MCIASGLERTAETARIVSGREPERWPELNEWEGGRLHDVPEEELEDVFTRALHVTGDDDRFLGGESLGEVRARVAPALERLVAREWDTCLAVLHGGINRVLLSYALAPGGVPYLGGVRAGGRVHQRPRPRPGRLDRSHGELHSLRPAPSRARHDDGAVLEPVEEEPMSTTHPAHDAVVELLRRDLDQAEYDEIRELWKAHSIAEDNRDLPGLIATLTDDCVYELVQTGERWEGHEGAARFYTQLLTAFPDVKFMLTDIVIGPQGVVEQADVEATFAAEWLGQRADRRAGRVEGRDLLPLGPRAAAVQGRARLLHDRRSRPRRRRRLGERV